jgi:hypothetical protein
MRVLVNAGGPFARASSWRLLGGLPACARGDLARYLSGGRGDPRRRVDARVIGGQGSSLDLEAAEGLRYGAENVSTSGPPPAA